MSTRTKQTKCCWKCKEIKPVTDFNAHHRNPDGPQQHCRQCQRELSQLNTIMRRENAEQVSEAKRANELDFLRTYQHDTLLAYYRQGISIGQIAQDRAVSAASLTAYFVERYGEKWRRVS